MRADLADSAARLQAVTTFAQNIVVTAGAGTGKTSLLVERVIHLLIKSPDPVPLSNIVALTFVEKAGQEIKSRLRERLSELLARPDAAAGLRERYYLSSDELQARAEAALQEVERSQIGTIHSFAAHLLRLYPIESGVDPRFQPDDGTGFEEHFAREWGSWLDGELGSRGRRQELWKRVLRQAGLETLRELADSLVKDLIPLRDLAAQVAAPALSPALALWLREREKQASALLALHAGGKRNIENLLAAARALFDLILAGGPAAVQRLDDEARAVLTGKEAHKPVDWETADFEQAKGVIKTAQALLGTDHAYLSDVLAVLVPFAESCRQRFIESGRVTFDGLLAKARDLLKGHPDIRERLKVQFRAILVDEFQDTDPVQYEILLFLAERMGQSAPAWEQVELEPGKLFIVGDPKQSIFAFRRADIEAFQNVTGLVRAQNGLSLKLTTNFRSDARVLAPVNGLFARLIVERPNLQPAYDALEAPQDRPMGAKSPGVELRLVTAGNGGHDSEGDEDTAEDTLDAEQAARAEAEALASWLKREVIGREGLIDARGCPCKVEPGHIAILFRTFTRSWDYFEALRRHQIPYIAEGEKHFYKRQEVIDLVNVLRCVCEPKDELALVGLLRSPLGALTDRDILELRGLGALDYRSGHHPRLDRHPRATHLQRLYAVLESLHQDCPRRPLPEAVQLVVERLPVMELAAASLHGEQGVANLWKLAAMADELVAEPDMTLAGFVELLRRRIADLPEETESALAEESLEAVRVLSIHKAKGLEFPIVIMVGMQADTARKQEQVSVHHDWTTNVVGLRMGQINTMGGVFVAEKLDARMAAERRRLLYVAMTRARERLVLSGALTSRQGSGTLLALLKEGLGESLGNPDARLIEVGEGRIAQRILPAQPWKPRLLRLVEDSPRSLPDLPLFQARWKSRVDRWDTYAAQPAFVTPTAYADLMALREGSLFAGTRRDGESGLSEKAIMIGTIVHKALETWDYSRNANVLLEVAQTVAERVCPELFRENLPEVQDEIRDLLSGFIASDAYAELREAQILRRELPFFMPFAFSSSLSPSLMEGRIDLLYQTNGHLWVADYKTDKVTEADLAERGATYQPQGRIYCDAVRRALGREPAGFKLIFMRLGKAITVSV